jgi:hypothetical protein
MGPCDPVVASVVAVLLYGLALKAAKVVSLRDIAVLRAATRL